MNPFHLMVHTCASLPADGAVDINGSTVTPSQAAAGGGPFSIGFDEAYRRLESLPRLFIEGDGSFVWRTDDGQIDGNLFDRDGRLLFVELKGACSGAMFRQCLDCLAAESLLFQLVEHGIFVDRETVFRLFFPEHHAEAS